MSSQFSFFELVGTQKEPDSAPDVPPELWIGTGRLNKGVVGTLYDDVTFRNGTPCRRILSIGIGWPDGAVLGAAPDEWQPYKGGAHAEK